MDQAVDAAAETLRAELGDAPDLVVAFVSAHHSHSYDRLVGRVATHFGKALLIGCSGGGIIGAGHEVEHRAALSLTAAILPGVKLSPFHISSDELPDADEKPAEFAAHFPVTPESDPHFLLLPDPFSCDPDVLINGLDTVFPSARKIGGIASGGTQLGSSVLFLDRSTHRDGAVGLALSGNVTIDSVVAQGCRPIGTPFVITRCRQNIIEELSGKQPLKLMRDLYATLDARDQKLFQRSLFLGIEMKDDQIEFHQGDFLIRNLGGIDPESGALAVGALLEPYLAVQFHLRDADTATADLNERLLRYKAGGGTPQGALLFSCLGRGEHLFGRPDHDTDLFREHLGPVPLGGFFCNGEIGPVAGTTFIHGYTSSFGLFRSKN